MGHDCFRLRPLPMSEDVRGDPEPSLVRLVDDGVIEFRSQLRVLAVPVEHPLGVILLRQLHCRRPCLNNCRVHHCHGHPPQAATVHAVAMCSICRWSVPQQPPSTLICENRARRSLYCWPSSTGSPSSRSVASSSSAWLRFDALARGPRSLSIHVLASRTAPRWLGG